MFDFSGRPSFLFLLSPPFSFFVDRTPHLLRNLSQFVFVFFPFFKWTTQPFCDSSYTDYKMSPEAPLTQRWVANFGWTTPLNLCVLVCPVVTFDSLNLESCTPRTDGQHLFFFFFNLTHQMQCFTCPWDTFSISIWKIAHRKLFAATSLRSPLAVITVKPRPISWCLFPLEGQRLVQTCFDGLKTNAMGGCQCGSVRFQTSVIQLSCQVSNIGIVPPHEIHSNDWQV